MWGVGRSTGRSGRIVSGQRGQLHVNFPAACRTPLLRKQVPNSTALTHAIGHQLTVATGSLLAPRNTIRCGWVGQSYSSMCSSST